MKLLVLGGTVFLGRAVATHARDAGHDVTCVARGESGSFPAGVRTLAVDRSQPGSLSALDDYDAVIDVARRPSFVANALADLAEKVGHWTFVSTISVYADNATPGQEAETSPLLEPATPDMDETDMRNYGRLKVACEDAVLMADVPSFTARAGLIVGPEDISNRFPYWVSRMDRARQDPEVLAPGSPADPVQWIDARDLAAWLVHGAETGLTGVYDGVGLPIPRLDLLTGIARGLEVDPTLTWVDESFLHTQQVNPWMGERSLPLWVPTADVPGTDWTDHTGLMTRDTRSAVDNGLRQRPVEDTARDTLAWLRTGPTFTMPCGLEPADEAAVLAAWAARE